MILESLVDLVDIGIKSLNKSFEEIRMCELGDQRMKWNKYRTGKRYFLEFKKVIEHVSIDINGKNGALPLNMNESRTEWRNYFDIISDFGTSEHVTNQYMMFYNTHNFCKIGGVMAHVNPIVGGWKGHSPYRYHQDFYFELAKINGYEVILSELRLVEGRFNNMKDIDRTIVCAVLKKKQDNFASKEEFLKISSKIDGFKND